MNIALRRLLPVAIALVVAGQVPARAAGTDPTISGLSPAIASTGTAVTISGSGFAQNGCSNIFGFVAPPTVVFTPMDGSQPISVTPNATDPTQCNDSRIVVPAPAFGSAAGISVYANASQPNGGQRNDPNQGVDPMITAPLTITPTELTGMVASSVTIKGDNVMPATAVPESLTLVLDKGPAPYHCNPGDCSPLQPTGWSPAGIMTNPGQTSGEIIGGFNVSWDRRAPNDASKQSHESFDGGRYSFSAPSVSDQQVIAPGVGLAASFAGTDLGVAPHGTITFPGAEPVKWKSKSSESFTAIVPPGVRTNGVATVKIDGWEEGFTLPVVILPVIRNGAMTVTGGQSVQIVGSTFGGARGAVQINGHVLITTISSWTDSAVTLVMPEDVYPGTLSLARPTPGRGIDVGGGPQVTVVPTVAGLESDQIPAGSEVNVDGHSMGTQPGTITVGGKPADILLWSLTNVVARVPDLSPGAYPVTISTREGRNAGTVTLHVVAGSANASVPSGAPSNDCRQGHKFQKPAKTDSPVQITVAMDKQVSAPGARVPLTVTVRLNGKLIQGATIQLSMVCSAGSKYAFNPESGTTGPDGTFRSTVTLGDRPGDNIIRAESGVFSDEDHVLALGAATAGSSLSTNPWAVSLIVVVLLVAGIAGAYSATNLRRRR